MTPKTAYLTIDDAPSTDFTQKVDFLIERRIPAVFFAQGKYLEAEPAQALYAIERGFTFGNHSYNHPFFSHLTLDECFDQITRTDRLIEDLYRQAGVPRPAKYFRFPFGDKGGLKLDDVFSSYEGEGLARKERLQVFLRDLGYTKPDFPGITYPYYRAAGLHTDVDWYWTYDTIDWGPLDDNPPFGIDTLEKILARMDEHAPEDGRGLNTPGSDEIILMHDFAQTTPIFFAMIERLLAKGIVFQPVPTT